MYEWVKMGKVGVVVAVVVVVKKPQNFSTRRAKTGRNGYGRGSRSEIRITKKKFSMWTSHHLHLDLVFSACHSFQERKAITFI